MKAKHILLIITVSAVLSGCVTRYVPKPGFRTVITREIKETTILESETPPGMPGMPSLEH